MTTVAERIAESSGFYKPSAIVGYRNRPVYIRGSRHTPMNHEAVRDAMPEYFRLLREEKHLAVRAILSIVSLRQQKALHLYHLIREYNLLTWWD